VHGDGDDAVLEVEDDGPGVAPEDAERIFERFYRSETSRSREFGGAGLGLSIVAAVASAHGGSARAEPAPSGGARFLVRSAVGLSRPSPTSRPALRSSRSVRLTDLDRRRDRRSGR
jgi:two-component system OmpR family sensor kinase